IMIPAMIREGYRRGFSAGAVATRGRIGIVITPSIPLSIYGITKNTALGDRILAALVPRFPLVLLLYLMSRHMSKKHGYGGDVPKASWKERRAALWHAKWTLLMPVVVLGGIYGGIFTPTEASGVAVAYSLVLALIYSETKITQI